MPTSRPEPNRPHLVEEIRELLTALEEFAPDAPSTAGLRQQLEAVSGKLRPEHAVGPTGGVRGIALSSGVAPTGDVGPTLVPIGFVESTLDSLDLAPKQGSEGGPDAWIEVQHPFADGLLGLQAGDALLVLTWLDRADRGTLQVHPRDNPALPLAGVFHTRSADRPNPIGLHPVILREIRGRRLLVGPLEAVNGTPVLDLKPQL